MKKQIIALLITFSSISAFSQIPYLKINPNDCPNKEEYSFIKSFAKAFTGSNDINCFMAGKGVASHRYFLAEFNNHKYIMTKGGDFAPNFVSVYFSTEDFEEIAKTVRLPKSIYNSINTVLPILSIDKSKNNLICIMIKFNKDENNISLPQIYELKKLYTPLVSISDIKQRLKVDLKYNEDFEYENVEQNTITNPLDYYLFSDFIDKLNNNY